MLLHVLARVWRPLSGLQRCATVGLLLLLLGGALCVGVELGEVRRRLLGLGLLCVDRLVARVKLRGLGLVPGVLLLGRLWLLRHPGVCAADLSGELLPKRAGWLKPWAAGSLLALLGYTVTLLAVPRASPSRWL